MVVVILMHIAMGIYVSYSIVPNFERLSQPIVLLLCMTLGPYIILAGAIYGALRSR